MVAQRLKEAQQAPGPVDPPRAGLWRCSSRSPVCGPGSLSRSASHSSAATRSSRTATISCSAQREAPEDVARVAFPLRRRNRRPHARARAAAALRGRGDRADDQRPLAGRASLPSPGRHDDDPRALRHARRAALGLRRRRAQQCRRVARAGGDDGRHARQLRLAALAPALRDVPSALHELGKPLGATVRAFTSPSGRCATSIRLHRRVDVDGRRSVLERNAARSCVSGRRQAVCGGGPARAVHALPAGAPRRRSDRRGDRRPRSIVFDQAENRLHAQKALLALAAHRPAGFGEE